MEEKTAEFAKTETTTKYKKWMAILIDARWDKKNRPNAFQRFWGWDIFFRKVPVIKTMFTVNIGVTVLINYLF